MTRFIVIAVAIALALTVFTLVDAILLDRMRVRGVPKGLWIVIIVLLPILGPVLWLTVGRGSKASATGSRRGPVAPDDDIDFLRGLNIPKPENKPDEEDPQK